MSTAIKSNLKVLCKMKGGATKWEYHDKLSNDNELVISVNAKAAIREIKLHGLTITNRELIDDELIITYS